VNDLIVDEMADSEGIFVYDTKLYCCELLMLRYYEFLLHAILDLSAY
jgi:hypothetical protein